MRPVDLVVLVADASMKAAMEGLLSRAPALQITSPQYRILVHPNRDSGCRLQGHELLRTVQREFQYALLMFDLEGCGAIDVSRSDLESAAEAALATAGWENRSASVVIVPELDVWVWSDSPWVDRILGWESRSPALRAWLAEEGFTFGETGKPDNPKAAMEKALRVARKPRSSSLYRELAEHVSVERCLDPAFLKLKGCLQKWFGK